ncbi:MAG: hypothetical protein WB402_07680, partial [Sulfuricaulis sp.]
LGPRPRRRLIEDVMTALPDVLDRFPTGTTVALLLTRPGKGPISEADRQWATLLTEVAAYVGISIEPVFRAHDESLVQVDPAFRAAS